MRGFAALIFGLAILAGGRYWLSEQMETVKREVAKPSELPVIQASYSPIPEASLPSSPIELNPEQIQSIDEMNRQNR